MGVVVNQIQGGMAGVCYYFDILENKLLVPRDVIGE
jgi:hypothetical protein